MWYARTGHWKLQMNKPSINKVPNGSGSKGKPLEPPYVYEVYVPLHSTSKLYNIVEFIYNGYPSAYVKMLNNKQREEKHTVEQIVNYWSKDVYDTNSAFRISFDEEKDAAFFLLAFGDN